MKTCYSHIQPILDLQYQEAGSNSTTPDQWQAPEK